MVFEVPMAVFSLLIGYLVPGFFLSFLLFKHDELSRMERIAVSMALSVALIGTLMTFLGMTFGFTAISTFLILAIVTGTSYYAGRDEIDEFSKRFFYSADIPRLTPAGGLAFFTVVFQLFFAIYYSSYFPIDGGDAVTFHAPLERLYAESGKLVAGDGVLNLYTPLAHGFHLFISWFYLFNGPNDFFARIASPLLFLGSCLFLHAIANRLFNQRVAAIATVIFASTPLLIAHAQIAYINLPETFFVLAGMFALIIALKSENFFHFMAAGILGGFAALVKPSGMIAFALPALALILYFKKFRSLAPLIALAIGALLSGSMIWYVANAGYFLNPASAFYLFGPKTVDAPLQFVTYLFFDNQVAVNQGVGPFFLAFGLVGAALMYSNMERRKWQEKFALLWLLLMVVVSELFLLKLGSRFTMPSIGVMAIFSAYGLDRLSASRSQLVAFAAILLFTACLFPSFAIGSMGFKAARISYETNTLQLNFWFPDAPSNDAFMRYAYGPVVDGMTYVNWNTPTDARLLTNHPYTYFINRTLFVTSDVKAAGTLEGALSYMRANNITYVFLTYADSGADPYADNPVEKNIGKTDVFRLVFMNQRSALYRVDYAVAGKLGLLGNETASAVG
jgi:hypothetical protein